MEGDQYPSSSDPAEVPPQLGRRHLLKVLGATGGVLTVSTLLPAHWTKPAVEVGYLPVHAQISGQIDLSDPEREIIQPLEVCTSNGNVGNRYQMSFGYSSIFGDVQPGTVVTQSYRFTNGVSGAFDKILEADNISGDGFQGTISYTFCSAFGPPENNSVITTLTLRTPAGRISEVITITTPRPPGAFGQNKGEGSESP